MVGVDVGMAACMRVLSVGFEDRGRLMRSSDAFSSPLAHGYIKNRIGNLCRN